MASVVKIRVVQQTKRGPLIKGYATPVQLQSKQRKNNIVRVAARQDIIYCESKNVLILIEV